MSQLLVVRIRGTINVRYDIKKTLELLRLKRTYSATIVPKNEYYLGMLHKAKDYIAWGEIDFETAKQLILKRGKTVGGKPVDDSIAKIEGFNNVDELVKAIVDGVKKFSELKVIKPYFYLAPPKGGFKRSTKRSYQYKGVLGENKEILSIVAKMI
ncbi:MAG: 50S ribosomal protein L30 [Nitrososphaeria archaeon]